jgi:hypothetical protein
MSLLVGGDQMPPILFLDLLLLAGHWRWRDTPTGIRAAGVYHEATHQSRRPRWRGGGGG